MHDLHEVCYLLVLTPGYNVPPRAEWQAEHCPVFKRYDNFEIFWSIEPNYLGSPFKILTTYQLNVY